MAVFRVDKSRDYTVMSNHHLKNRDLSLKAMGLLSKILSLPEDWDYTTRGLAAICKEGVGSIGATLKELEVAGYIHRTKLRDAKGRITDIDRDDQIERDALYKALNPYEILEQRMVKEQLYAAIAALPDKQRGRIYARYFLNMSVTAIARAEGVSKAAVSNSIHEALEKLLAALIIGG